MKNVLKQITGVALMIYGVFSGLYVGGWLMFLKPILIAITAYDAGTLTGKIVFSTVIKCIFASVTGFLIFYLLFWLGANIYYSVKSI